MRNLLLYHVSYDRIPRFRLRVPQNRLYGEDGKIPRICLSTSVERCVNAKPLSAQALYQARELDLPMALYVYTFCSEYIPEGKLLSPEDLHGLVPDAEDSREYWLLDPDVPYTESRFVCIGGIFYPNDAMHYAEAIKLFLTEEDIPAAAWLEQAIAAYNRKHPSCEPLTSDRAMVNMADKIALAREFLSKEER